MALVDITNKIIAEAEAVVAEIKRETATKVAQIAELSEQKLAEQKRAKIAQLDAQIASAQKVALSKARRDARSVVDNARRTMIDEVLTGATAQIADLDDETYGQWIGKLLNTIPTSERETIAQVFAPEMRLTITQKICAQYQISAPVSADEAISAGLRLESDTLAFDMTAKQFVNDTKSELEPMIANKLFS